MERKLVGMSEPLEWKEIEKVFRGIFKRKWYTNHGPLLQKLEERLKSYFNVRHVVCMTNYTIAKAIADKVSGDDLCVVSLYPSKSPIPAACVITDNNQLNAELCNIRSSYGSGLKVEVPLTGNGRMSEAQAAIILVILEKIQ